VYESAHAIDAILSISEELMTELESWLSVEEIAVYLRVSKETVYRWLEKKKIPAHRVGKLWKFRASEIDAWVLRGSASPDGQREFATEK